MINKSIKEICEELEIKGKIDIEEFNLLYKKFYTCLLGYIRTKEYLDKKDLLDLGRSLINIRVINGNTDIFKKKREIEDTLIDLQKRKR